MNAEEAFDLSQKKRQKFPSVEQIAEAAKDANGRKSISELERDARRQALETLQKAMAGEQVMEEQLQAAAMILNAPSQTYQ